MENIPPEDDIQFEPEFLERVSGIALSGISPASALDLMAKLLTEIPTASKSAIDKIKVMDKVINSARQMLETKVKTEDVPAIMKRLDEMEAEMDKLASAGTNSSETLSDLKAAESEDGRRS